MTELYCPVDECEYSTETNRGLSIHASAKHPDLEHDFSNKDTFECAHCGDKFKDYKSRRSSKGEKNNFCSRGCKDSYEAKDGLDTQCAECGDEVHVPPSHIEEVGGYKQKNHFCDKKCESSFKSENWVKENHPSWDGGRERLYCKECGDEFWVKPSVVEKSKFCSTNCWNKNKSIEKEEYNCANCGEIVKKYPYNVKSENTTCSTKCLHEYLSEIRKGESNPQWKGGRFLYYGPNWQEQRKKALERDGYDCQECGMTRDKHVQHYNEDLHVHHKVPRRQIIDEDEPTFEQFELANSLDNLVTLCNSCHGKLESGLNYDIRTIRRGDIRRNDC